MGRNFSRMAGSVSCLVVLALAIPAAWSQELSSPGDLSDERLRTDAQSSFEGVVASLARRGAPHYEYWNAKYPQPMDNYLYPVTIRFEPRKDGTYYINHGCVIYSCPPGGSGPWNFDRYWTAETEYHGGSMPERDEMLASTIEGIRGLVRRYFSPPSSYYRIREIAIPPDPEFLQTTADECSWLVSIVCDVKKSNTVMEVNRRMDRFHFKKDKGKWRAESHEVGRADTIAAHEYDKDFMRALKGLDKLDFGAMLGNEDPAGSIPEMVIPDDAELVGFFRKTFSASMKNFRAIFGADAPARIISVRMIARAPGTRFWRRFDGGGFEGAFDVYYAEKTGELERTEKQMRYNLTYTKKDRVEMPYIVVKAVPLFADPVVENVKRFQSLEEAGDQLKTIGEVNPGK